MTSYSILRRYVLEPEETNATSAPGGTLLSLPATPPSSVDAGEETRCLQVMGATRHRPELQG